jgi:hypothetical protein
LKIGNSKHESTKKRDDFLASRSSCVPPYTEFMSETHDPGSEAGPADPRIDLLRRALELSGVEPLVAGGLAREHYTRIVSRGRRFEVTDAEGSPYDAPQGDDPILHLAERIKESIPAKFLTDEAELP